MHKLMIFILLVFAITVFNSIQLRSEVDRLESEISRINHSSVGGGLVLKIEKHPHEGWVPLLLPANYEMQTGDFVQTVYTLNPWGK